MRKKPAAKPKVKPAPTVPTAAELLADVRIPQRSPDDLFPASVFPSKEAMFQSLGVPADLATGTIGLGSGQNHFQGNPHTAEEQSEAASEEELAPQPTERDGDGEKGKIVDSPVSAGSVPGPELLPESSRARKTGEKKHEYWERMRKAARLAGLARGQGPGTAYVWATEQTDREFPPPEPVVVEEPVPEPIAEPEPIPESIVVSPAPAADDGSVSGLGDLPASWPALPANAQLQAEIAWVTANRLRVRSGTGVDLSRALSPAPSYSALSWLETSILFPAKFADISVKATADQDDEKEDIRREKLAIEEIRGILAEMLEPGDV